MEDNTLIFKLPLKNIPHNLWGNFYPFSNYPCKIYPFKFNWGILWKMTNLYFGGNFYPLKFTVYLKPRVAQVADLGTRSMMRLTMEHKVPNITNATSTIPRCKVFE